MVDIRKLPPALVAQEYVDHNGLPALPNSDAFRQQLVNTMSKQYAVDLLTSICQKDEAGVAFVKAVWDAAWERYDMMWLDVLERRMKAIQKEKHLYDSGTWQGLSDENLKEVFSAMLLKDVRKEFK